LDARIRGSRTGERLDEKAVEPDASVVDVPVEVLCHRALGIA
jgi:hypothetical protein